MLCKNNTLEGKFFSELQLSSKDIANEISLKYLSLIMQCVLIHIQNTYAHNLSILLTSETFWIFLLMRKWALRKWQKNSERKSHFYAQKVVFPKLTGESIWWLGINSPHTLIQFLSVPRSNCSTPMQSAHYSAFCFPQMK